MPGSVQAAVPNGVFPQNLCTSFQEGRAYLLLANQYHDGSQQKGQLVQSSRRTFKLTQRLTATKLATLNTFLTGSVNRYVVPFIYYNPFDAILASGIGSNYDPSGNSIIGRVTVVAQGNWSQQTGLQRSDALGIVLIEVE